MASAAPEIPSLVRDRAFEALYRRYVKDVYHYSLALLRNPADAEDVTQTTFMNAYRAFKRGEHIEKPQNWLIKIAHNAARTRYARAARRVNEVPLDDHLEQLAVPESDRPDVRAILDALGNLPLNQRAALVMRELEGRTYAEIADTLGVSVAAVETLIFRARRSLRMKASAIRVLGVVPVPGSLSQLAGAGGVAAGGGAIAGSGFVLKAAVAIVAGVVASGINSDRPPPATAADRPAAHAALATTKSVGPAEHGATSPKHRIAKSVVHIARPSAGGPTAGAPRGPRTDDDSTQIAAPAGPSQKVGPPDAQTTAAATQSPTAAPAQQAQPVAGTVETVTAPVQSATATAGSATSALPVQSPVPVAVPSLPPPQLPSPPPLPSLP